MKNTGIIILTVIAVMGFMSISAQGQTDSSKTTFYTKKNKVVVWEAPQEVKVKIFNKNDSTEMKAVYEGIFTEGKEYERYTVNHAVDWGLSLFSKNKKECRHHRVNPHWEGIAWGFTTVTDGVRFNGIDGVSLKTERSNEFCLNLSSISFSLYKKSLMIYSGFGISWKNFHLDNNTRLVEQNDITIVQTAPVGISYKKSRLRVFNINAPLALEWQPKLGQYRRFYISAGIVAGLNLFRSQKLKYKSADGKKVKQHNKGFNVARVSFEFMGQIGLNNIGVFVKYSPIGLFEQGQGPDVQTASLGLIWSF